MSLEKRVLIVDNVDMVRQNTADLLASRKYQVFIARGQGDALLEDAWRLAAQARCHMALIDLRLIDDLQEADWTGFALAVEMARACSWVVCAMLTSFGSFDLAIRARAEGVDLEFISKEIDPKTQLQQVEQIFNRRVRCHWNQELIGFDELTRVELEKRVAQFAADTNLDLETANLEVRELLGRLFPNAEKLQLRLLNPPQPSQTLLQTHSILLGVIPFRQGSDLPEVVVKLAGHAAISTEIKNYHEFVKGQVEEQRFARFEHSAFTWHLAGIVYSLIGTALHRTMTFKQFYADKKNSVQDLAAVLENLFDGAMRRWYARTEEKEMDLVEHYFGALCMKEARLNSLLWKDKDAIPIKPLASPLPNPQHWLEKAAHHSKIFAQQNIIHGDLHSRNILVGPHRGVWLIDFERTGYGHALRDFIELETDIKFNLLQCKSGEMNLFVELEMALLAQDMRTLTRKNMTTPPTLQGHLPFERAFQTITHVRQHARARIYHADMRDYFWGLLLETLFVATLDSLPDSPRTRATISAGLLCVRLGDGKKLADAQILTRFRVLPKTVALKHAPRIGVASKPIARPATLTRAFPFQVETVKGFVTSNERFQELLQTIQNSDAPPIEKRWFARKIKRVQDGIADGDQHLNALAKLFQELAEAFARVEPKWKMKLLGAIVARENGATAQVKKLARQVFM